MERVAQALLRCEQELRAAAAEAAQSGDYDLLSRITESARVVAAVLSQWNRNEGDRTTTAPLTPPSEPRPRRVLRLSRGQGYPRFLTEKQDLIKVGWSKREKREYQHRAGREVLQALVQTLEDASTRKRLFTMDLMSDALVRLGVPDYQAYVWLAWLRAEGLVEQHGRQGYSVAAPGTLAEAVDARFEQLSLKKTS